MGVIYKITSPTGRLYVGKTYDLAARIAAYKCDLKKDRYTTVLFCSLKKYGWDAHILEVIEEVADEHLEEREIFWIAELKTYRPENENGMNMTRGGECGSGSWMYNTERRKKQAARFTGTGNPFHGKKHTEENKKRQAAFAKELALKNGTKVPRWGAEKGWENKKEPIVCYDATGKFFNEYASMTDAEIALGINHSSIFSVCNGKRTHAGKFIFRYKTENYPLQIDPGCLEEQQVKRPVLFLNEDFEVMAEYPSALEASIELQVPKTTINRAALNNWLWPIRTGHIFIYKDLYDGLPDLWKN